MPFAGRCNPLILIASLASLLVAPPLWGARVHGCTFMVRNFTSNRNIGRCTLFERAEIIALERRLFCFMGGEAV